MASPVFIPKKSTIASKVPTTSDLQPGEICLNYADAKIYGRHPGNNTIVTFTSGGGGGAAVASISANPPSSPSSGTLWIEESTLRAFVYYDFQWVEFGLSGAQSYEVRHAYAAPYSYTGTAADGTSEAATTWTITRLQISSAGTTTKTTATGAWSNRSNLTYT